MPLSVGGPQETELRPNRRPGRDELNQGQKEHVGKRLKDILNGQQSLEDVASWIRECSHLDLDLDIDQLARFAAFHGNLKAVECLVKKHNANLDRQDTFGRSAIFYCTCHTELVRYILSRSPEASGITDLNHQDSPNKRTPLHYAAKAGNDFCIHLLLANKANPEIRDHQNERPIDIVLDNYFRTKLLLALHMLGQVRSHVVYKMLVLKQGGNIYSHGIQVDINSDCVTWFHIPWMNGALAYDVLRRIALCLSSKKDKVDSYAIGINIPYWFKNHLNISTGRDLPYREPLYASDSGQSGTDRRVTTVFPCLVLRCKELCRQMRREAQTLRAKVDCNAVDALIPDERTLNETYYPSLPTAALLKRNNNQVVSREYKWPERSTDDDRSWPILMVPQLWLWRIDDCILTAHKDEVLKKEQFIGYRDGNAEIQTGLIIASRISAFGEKQDGKKFPSPLDIFETGVVQVLDEVTKYTDPATLSRPDMKEEHHFMFSIADIREELAMIRYVISQQVSILEDLIKDAECHNSWEKQSDPKITRNQEESMKRNWEKVKRSRNKLDEYLQRIEKIDRDAEMTEKRIQDQLNLKRTHASFNDARTGIILSTSVIGFTVITIIFAPLGFMTSLFALPIDGLLRNQFYFDGTDSSAGTEGTPAYTTRYIGQWFATAEIVTLAITISLVWLCLWLLGSTEASAALWGNHAEKKNKVDGKHEITTTADRSGSRFKGVTAGLRKRAVNFVTRRKQAEPGDTV